MSFGNTAKDGSGSSYWLLQDSTGRLIWKQDTTVINLTPTVDTSDYADGDVIDGIQTLTAVSAANGLSVELRSIVVRDLAAQDAAFDIIFFNQNPSNGTYTDNAAMDVHDTDHGFIVGHASILASDYTDFADSSVATVRAANLSITMRPTSGADDLYALLLCRGTPTYAAGTDLEIDLEFIRD